MRNAQFYELDQPHAILREAPLGFWRSLLRAPATAMDTILLWQERASQRGHLASLENRALRDMGLSRADVEREVSLPFWRGR